MSFLHVFLLSCEEGPVATVAPCDTCAGSQTKLRHAAMGQIGVTYQDDLGVTLNERARYFSFVLQHVSLEHLRHFGVFSVFCTAGDCDPTPRHDADQHHGMMLGHSIIFNNEI